MLTFQPNKSISHFFRSIQNVKRLYLVKVRRYLLLICWISVSNCESFFYSASFVHFKPTINMARQSLTRFYFCLYLFCWHLNKLHILNCITSSDASMYPKKQVKLKKRYKKMIYRNRYTGCPLSVYSSISQSALLLRLFFSTLDAPALHLTGQAILILKCYPSFLLIFQPSAHSLTA